MKRLKYRCLLGGKSYPIYVATTVLFLLMLAGIAAPLPMILALPGAVTALLICIWFARRLSPAERDITENTSLPLWNPVTPEIQELVRSKQIGTQFTLPQMLLGSLGIAVLVFLSGFAPRRNRHRTVNDPKTVLAAAAVFAVAGFIFMMIKKGIGANWLDIDETAVYTQIPIDHMYDITHHGRHGSTWTTSYLVFYQPDGRYILPAPHGSGECNTVTVIKFRKAITWIPTYERHPEDFMQ